MVGPLALALETAQDGIVTKGFLAPVKLGQARVANQQVTGDQGHPDHRLPIPVLLCA